MLPEPEHAEPEISINWQHRPSVNAYMQSLSNTERADVLLDVIDLYPNDAFLLGLYGKALLAINNPLQSIDYLEKATETEIGNASLFFSLGLAYQQMQRMGKALMALRKAVEVGSNADHIMVLIRFAQECGQYRLALSSATLGMQLHPQDDRFACAYVNVLLANGQPEVAVEWIGVNDKPNNADLAKIRYDIHTALGNTEEASSAQLDFQSRTIRQQSNYREHARSVLDAIPNPAMKAQLIDHWESKLNVLTTEPVANEQSLPIPRVAMSILVRDEVDIIEHNIRYHASVGVTHFCVTDNASVDGTREVLTNLQSEFSIDIIDEPSHTIDQDLWVTRMAKRIVDSESADWIIHNDADEFWVPENGQSLPIAIAGSLQRSELSNDEIGVLCCKRINMLPNKSDTLTEHYAFYNNVHVAIKNVPLRDGEEQWNNDNTNTVARLVMDKVMTRAEGTSDIEYGNHGATHALASVNCTGVSIYHYPVRTYAQFERKVVNYGISLEQNTRFSEGSSLHLRYWYRRYNEGKLMQDYEAICFSEAELEQLLADGYVEIDTRLRTFFS